MWKELSSNEDEHLTIEINFIFLAVLFIFVKSAALLSSLILIIFATFMLLFCVHLLFFNDNVSATNVLLVKS